MKIFTRQFLHRTGFTMVEVFVAVAIIAILISLIVPALTMVKKSADMAKQRAQFHSIEIALEAFRADFGDYPPSDDIGGMFDAYPGAMKLAEAVIGRDGFGFHPRSEFRNDGQGDWYGDGDDEPLYLPDVEGYIDDLDGLTDDEKDALRRENLTIRKGPYLELETANAVKLRDIYNLDEEPEGRQGLIDERFVLCDMFRLVKNNATGKKTGMPILYYRANILNFEHDPEINPDNNVYDHRDNRRIVDLRALWEGLIPQHPMRSANPKPYGRWIFYKNTLNPNFATDPKRPYRADSFILLSAGPDGLYGTPDDVFNFNKGE